MEFLEPPPRHEPPDDHGRTPAVKSPQVHVVLRDRRVLPLHARCPVPVRHDRERVLGTDLAAERFQRWRRVPVGSDEPVTHGRHSTTVRSAQHVEQRGVSERRCSEGTCLLSQHLRDELRELLDRPGPSPLGFHPHAELVAPGRQEHSVGTYHRIEDDRLITVLRFGEPFPRSADEHLLDRHPLREVLRGGERSGRERLARRQDAEFEQLLAGRFRASGTVHGDATPTPRPWSSCS